MTIARSPSLRGSPSSAIRRYLFLAPGPSEAVNWQSLLAAAALVGIATFAGGAAIRLGAVLGVPRGLASMLLVAGLVVAVVVLTLASLRRSSTPYW